MNCRFKMTVSTRKASAAELHKQSTPKTSMHETVKENLQCQMWSDSCKRTMSSSSNHMFNFYWKDSQSHSSKEARSQLCFFFFFKCPNHLWEHAATLAASHRQISKHKMVDTVVWGKTREPVTNKGIHIFFVLHIRILSPSPTGAALLLLRWEHVVRRENNSGRFA